MSESYWKLVENLLTAYIDLAVVRLRGVSNGNSAKQNVQTFQNLNNIATEMSQNLLECLIFCNNILSSVLVLKVRKETIGDLIVTFWKIHFTESVQIFVFLNIITESVQIFGHVFLVFRTKIMFNGIIDVFTSVD